MDGCKIHALFLIYYMLYLSNCRKALSLINIKASKPIALRNIGVHPELNFRMVYQGQPSLLFTLIILQ